MTKKEARQLIDDLMSAEGDSEKIAALIGALCHVLRDIKE